MMSRLLFFLLIAATLTSCESEDEVLTEGVIEYTVTYLDKPKDKPLISVLPSKVDVLFKKDRTITRIDGFMGLFSLNYLSFGNSSPNYTLMRVLDKKYMYEAKAEKTAYGYIDMDDVKIRFVNETKEIAGYMCSKAIATSKNMNYLPLILYYTYEIDIDNPNANNPFSEIDGVLMEFQVQLEGINMRFEAKNVKRTEVKEELFSIPSDYKKVDYNKMQEIITMFNEEE